MAMQPSGSVGFGNRFGQASTKTRHAGQNSLRFFGLRTPKTRLCLVLKIRVSMVRFRPRPPIRKARYVTVAGFFLWGIGALDQAGSGGVRWQEVRGQTGFRVQM
jgi:hypothetical protein